MGEQRKTLPSLNIGRMIRILTFILNFDLFPKRTDMRSVFGTVGSGRSEAVNLLDSILTGSSSFSEPKLGLNKKKRITEEGRVNDGAVSEAGVIHKVMEE